MRAILDEKTISIYRNNNEVMWGGALADTSLGVGWWMGALGDISLYGNRCVGGYFVRCGVADGCVGGYFVRCGVVEDWIGMTDLWQYVYFFFVLLSNRWKVLLSSKSFSPISPEF